MKPTERGDIVSEINALVDLLEDMPKEFVLSRSAIESRLEYLRDKIKSVNLSP